MTRLLAFFFASLALAQGQPARFLPFLARDAVVRESEGVVELAGPQTGYRVVVEDAAEKDAVRAGALVESYVKKITGMGPAGAKARRTIRLHSGAAAAKRFPELAGADAHGFVIDADANELHIAAGTGIGTLFGAWFFLQGWCDVRQLMQGALGEVHPSSESMVIPRELHVFNPGPDFELRIHSGLQALDSAAWLQDRPDTQRYQYHHNLFIIFSAEKYGKTHPHLFPTIDGKRYIPAPNINSGWQPVLSSEASVQRAIEHADEIFTANPLLKTLSLTPNDGSGWAEEDVELAKKRGVPIRDIFYEFMNRVARGIKTRWPDKFVTALSYLEYQEPPSFPLEDNCMIFIWTKDGNVEPEFDKWRGKARHFGNYQWIYGSAYPFPNHWPHAFQDFLQRLRREGAQAFKSEFYDYHGHGCVRLWVVSNLLWNADADVDAIQRDYFEHAYGREAAPAMARYFAQWEQIYERRRKPREYNLVDRKGAERKFAPITEADIAACSAALADAQKAVVGEANQKRIAMVAAMFDRARHYHDHVRHLLALRAGTDAPATLAEGEKQLSTAAAMLEAERAVYECNVAQIEPLADYCAVPQRGVNTESLPWRANYLAMDPRVLLVTDDSRWLIEDHRIARISRAVSALQSPDEARAFWARLTERHPVLQPYAATERLLLGGQVGALPNLLVNGSFEQPARPDSHEAAALLKSMRTYEVNWLDADHCEVPYIAAEGWNALQKRVSQPVKITRDTSEHHDGDASLRIESSGQLGALLTHVTLPDPHARYRLSFWHKAPNGGRVCYGAMFYLLRPTPYFDMVTDGSREWRKIEVEFPFNHNIAPDEKCALTLWIGQWTGKTSTPVWIDDVRLERLGE